MAFGKRGTAQVADPYALPRHNYQSAPSDVAIGNAFEIKYGALDIALMALCILLFGWLLQNVFRGASMHGMDYFFALFFAISVIGFFANLIFAASGRTKFRADGIGLKSASLFKETSLRWAEIDGFEIMSVNGGKSIFAKASGGGMLSLARRAAIPALAFRSKDFGLLLQIANNRPDLLGAALNVADKVGAKKQAQEFVSRFSS